jgi:DNA-binding transcriptional MerR regulator
MIPEKHFYTIGDVCNLTGIRPHVLRYWESQFKLLKPARRYSGHRKFTQKDIDLINRIKFLVIEKKFTLAGAKREINRQLSEQARELDAHSKLSAALPVLRELKQEVDECLDILRSGAEASVGPLEEPARSN